MLANQTYQDFVKQIEDNANEFTDKLREEILEEKRLQNAIQKAHAVARAYSGKNFITVTSGLGEVGRSAVDRLAPELTKDEREILVQDGMTYLLNYKYYGMTLTQRLQQSHSQLRGAITRSAAVGQKLDTRLLNITRVLNEVYPFGAHVNWDKRLFLAESIRLEHYLSQAVANKRGDKYLKWVLSDNHSHVDMCDHLANAVDTNVVSALAQDNYADKPQGIYFSDQVPEIPHPNCRCSLLPLGKPIKKERAKPSVIKRIIARIFGKKA